MHCIVSAIIPKHFYIVWQMYFRNYLFCVGFRFVRCSFQNTPPSGRILLLMLECVYLHCFCAVCQVTCLLSRIIADLDKLLRNHDIQCKLSNWYLVHGTPCSRSTSLEFDKRLKRSSSFIRAGGWWVQSSDGYLFIYLLVCLKFLF